MEVLSPLLEMHLSPSGSSHTLNQKAQNCLGPWKAPSWGQGAARQVLLGAAMRVSHSGLKSHLVLLPEIVAKRENRQ